MTAIAAYVRGRRAWIGGDSCISDDESEFTIQDPKVWRPRRGLLVGVSGSHPYCDAVAWVSWPSNGDLTDAWLRRDLAAQIRRGLGAEDPEGDALIVAFGRVYALEGTSLYAYRDRWGATGTGGREARAVIAALDPLRSSGARIVRRSLEVAAAYCSGVSPPFTILTTPIEVRR